MTGVVGRASARNGHLPRGLLALLPDGRLAQRVQQGDGAAFELLYDRHHARVLSLCRYVLGSHADAEDALQQAFASAYRDLVAGTEPDEFRPWLLTIARNRCVSMLRARRPETALDDAEPSQADLAEQVQQRADVRALAGDLAELPEEQRTAIVLAELDGVRHREIAQVLDCEPAKVKALVFQARTHLMHRRQARDTSCAEIREQIASRERGVLRRSHVRDHLQICPGCAEFRAEVRRQRAAFALLLPVVPSAGLKQGVLGATVGSGGAAAGGGGLFAAIAGGGALMKSSAVALTVAGGVAVTGAAVEVASNDADHPDARAVAAAKDGGKRAGSGGNGGTPAAGSGVTATGPRTGSPSQAAPALGTGLGARGAPGQTRRSGDATESNGRALGHDKPSDKPRDANPDKPPTPSDRGESPPGDGYGRGGTDQRGRSDEVEHGSGAGYGRGGTDQHGRSDEDAHGNGAGYGRGGTDQRGRSDEDAHGSGAGYGRGGTDQRGRSDEVEHGSGAGYGRGGTDQRGRSDEVEHGSGAGYGRGGTDQRGRSDEVEHGSGAGYGRGGTDQHGRSDEDEHGSGAGYGRGGTDQHGRSDEDAHGNGGGPGNAVVTGIGIGNGLGVGSTRGGLGNGNAYGRSGETPSQSNGAAHGSGADPPGEARGRARAID